MSLHRAAAALRKIDERRQSGAPYLAQWPSKVVAQAGSGELELEPDPDVTGEKRVPGDVAVPIRAGLPGVTLKVPSGARVELGYEQGDPRRPVAGAWEGGTPALELDLEVREQLRLKVGQPAAEHVLTTEAFVNLMLQFLIFVGPTLIPPITMAPAPPYPDPTNPTVLAFAAMLQAAGSAQTPQTLALALAAAFATAPPKPEPLAPGAPQLQPGIGCKGVLSG